MELDDKYIDGLKIGKGCEFGHIMQSGLDNCKEDIKEMQDILKKWEQKMWLLVVGVIMLAFFSGINAVDNLVAAFIR